jgi:FecR protein/Putative zinc-finger
MSRQKLDEIIAGIRSSEPDEQAIRGAAKRVFRNVFDSAYLPERVERIRGCSDFQALIPAYLDGGLPAARVALLEDHVSECVECRRALHQARAGDSLSEVPVYTAAGSRAKKQIRILPWAVAATLAIGTAIGITGAFNGLLPGQHAVRATVVTVQGTLYRVSDLGTSLVEAQAVIRNAEELRTGKGSRAIFRLLNGAKIEMAERSDVSVSRDWRGTSVQVERGHVIVESPEKGQKPFVVTAGDVRIPVRNAIFSLNRGIKGSRVAVASGSARVEAPEKTFELKAGEQAATDYRLVNASLTSEFAWSQNADHYLALLKEFSTLQKQIQNIPSPQLRYASDLAKYLPADTVLYAAIPNVGGTLSEAKRLFDQRLAESEVLREWWQQQPASRNGELDRALTQISSISQYLGNEIVMGVASPAPHQYSKPVFLADIRQSGLREYLEQNVPAQADVRVVSGSAPVTSRGKDSLFVSLDNNVVIASPDSAELQSVAQAVTNPGAGRFLSTPFYGRIAHSYSIGAGYLLAVDMEQMVAKSVATPKEVPPGFNNAQYLVLERREAAGDTETRASLSFAGARQGIASWLGAPGPMGSLDFVSPDANFAVAMVMKTPLTIVQELVAYASQNDAHRAQALNEMQSQLGVSVADDIAAPLGGDATFAIDGPLLPIPAWKIAVEVNDQSHLQQTISTLVDHFNQRTDSSQTGKLELHAEQVNSRTFYSLRSDKASGLAAYYTFVDGYLLAGPSEANLVQAISNRENGYTLASSSVFRNQLPGDSYTNFSAIVYHNAGKSLGNAAEQLRSSGNLSQSQQRALAALAIAGAPGLICVYGEPDRIVAATKGSFLGFNLGTLAGIEEGKPVLPLIASSARMSNSISSSKSLHQE